MAAKIITVVVLAICLIQGHDAQRLNLSGLAGMRNLVASAAGNAMNTAQNVGSKVTSAASNAAQNSLNAAQAFAGNLDPSDILDALKNVQAEIASRAANVQKQVERTIASAQQRAVSFLEQTVSSWNVDVDDIVSKAKALGVDVKDCSTNSVVDLGKSSVKSAVKCVTDKVDQARTLVKSLAGLVPEIAAVARKATSAVKECSENNSGVAGRGVCSVQKLIPIGVDGYKLGTSAASYTSEATVLVSTIREELIKCATRVAATKAVEAAGLSLQITSCVNKKISSSS